MHHKTITIMLDVSLERALGPAEVTLMTKHVGEMEQIVSIAAGIIKHEHSGSSNSTSSSSPSPDPSTRPAGFLSHRKSPSPSPDPTDPLLAKPTSFSSDMGVIAAVYYVAVNSYNKPLRERAITVLKSARRREGLWDSAMIAGVCEKSWAERERGALDMSQVKDGVLELADLLLGMDLRSGGTATDIFESNKGAPPIWGPQKSGIDAPKDQLYGGLDIFDINKDQQVLDPPIEDMDFSQLDWSNVDFSDLDFLGE